MKREKIYRTFSNMPRLETERLVLRKMCVEDAEDMYSYARLADVTKYLTWSPHPNVNYTKNYLQYVETKYAAGEFFDWAVTEKSSGKMIGTCGFTRFDYNSDGAEVGYVINPVFRGRGFAAEALGAVVRFGFRELNLVRIEARYMEGNAASRRVMDKTGMHYEGMYRASMLVKNEYKNICVCSVLANEYL